MAQFRATIKGQRGEASRLGSTSSGLSVTANGWTAGVKINAYHRSTTHVGPKEQTQVEEDVFDVFLTAGSSGRGRSLLLFSGTAREIEAKLV